MLDFVEDLKTLQVVDTNKYHWCMDSLDKGPSSEPDAIVAKYLFLAITTQMRHCLRDQLTNYTDKIGQFYTPF
jgi:hypothetical protein